MAAIESLLNELDRDGFAVLRGVYAPERVAAMRAGLTEALEAAARAERDEAIRSLEGSIYAARNVLELWPPAANAWREPALLDALAAVLGQEFGLVRVLYFDKPPERTWALPWHKDLTIAVQDNGPPSQHFRLPTRKAGVPHVEAPLEILQRMLTARIHLDDITQENGPLKVLRGSHLTGKDLELGEVAPQNILAKQGDVLLMRPLLVHCSNRSHPGTRRHRRILHLEFAGSPDLPDGYAWHSFLPAR